MHLGKWQMLKSIFETVIAITLTRNPVRGTRFSANVTLFADVTLFYVRFA
jgi:hypothetical protein